MSNRQNPRLSRRKFGATIASAAAIPAAIAQQSTQAPAAAPNPNTSQQRRGTAPEVPPFDGKIEFARKDVAPKVTPQDLPLLNSWL